MGGPPCHPSPGDCWPQGLRRGSSAPQPPSPYPVHPSVLLSRSPDSFHCPGPCSTTWRPPRWQAETPKQPWWLCIISEEAENFYAKQRSSFKSERKDPFQDSISLEHELCLSGVLVGITACCSAGHLALDMIPKVSFPSLIIRIPRWYYVRWGITFIVFNPSHDMFFTWLT